MAFSINNPDDLEDEDWSKLLNDYAFVKNLEYKNLSNVFKEALGEVLSKMFSK